LSWLTIFGDKAEVLAPASLRQEVVGLIESLGRLYGVCKE